MVTAVSVASISPKYRPIWLLVADERAERLAAIEAEYRASVERLVGSLRERIDDRASAGPRIAAL